MGFIYLLTPVVVWVTVCSAIVYCSEVVDFSFVLPFLPTFSITLSFQLGNLFGLSFFKVWQLLLYIHSLLCTPVDITGVDRIIISLYMYVYLFIQINADNICYRVFSDSAVYCSDDDNMSYVFHSYTALCDSQPNIML